MYDDFNLRMQEQIEAAELDKCEMMRRAFGLVVSNDLAGDFDCNECELIHKCDE